MTLAWTIARRELRAGLRGFAVLLACLALGVAAIAGVGTVRAAIQSGLAEQGAVILGGEAQVEFTYRFATAEERAHLDRIATRVSEIVDFRSMAAAGEVRVLTQVKGVDGAWPLLGQVELVGGGPLETALAGANGLPGAVLDRVLAEQLGLAPGDRFDLGGQPFVLGAVLSREPDNATGGFSFAPRTLVRTEALVAANLLAPGTLYDSAYRLDLPEGADLAALEAETRAAFPDAGLRWSDIRRPAPGVERFVDRIGSFLVLVGLAGLAVGGVGVASAVRAYLEGKIATIATLRTLGADGRLIFRAYLLQIAVLVALGIALGLALGIGLPLLLAPVIEASLPFPADLGLSPRAALEAAFYGVVSAFLFALWPLGRTESIRAAALYRGALGGAMPRPGLLMAMAVLLVALVGGAVVFTAVPSLALGTAGGVAGALVLLALAGWVLARLARRAARSAAVRGRPVLRLALAAIGAPRAETLQVVLALGLGLSVLAAVGQIDSNLRAAIARDLPSRAPAYFFVDIQPAQIDAFRARITGNPAVTRMESAPMLRGMLTRINGRDAREVAGNHWVVQGDRGITYADALPEGTRVVAGQWWPEGFDGPPQVSFAAEEAAEMGLVLGDRITVNVLGRDIEAEITSLREVDFSTGGMGFVLTLNKAALAGAPHGFLATVYLEGEAEAGLLRDISKDFPNVTAIGVKDAIARVSEALTAIAQATLLAAAATLVTGFVVLIGAAAAGERARSYEAAVLKVLGASRGRVLASFALRSALMGAAAGLVAIVTGGLAGWAVLELVMEADFTFNLTSALQIVAAGILATLAAGFVFMLRPLRARPAGVLRAQD